jgi:hypothetical protein
MHGAFFLNVMVIYCFIFALFHAGFKKAIFLLFHFPLSVSILTSGKRCTILRKLIKCKSIRGWHGQALFARAEFAQHYSQIVGMLSIFLANMTQSPR